MKVVLDCKLVPLHDTCQSLPAVCYRPCNVHAVRLAMSAHAKIHGGGQNVANRSQPFLEQSSPILGACRGVPLD